MLEVPNQCGTDVGVLSAEDIDLCNYVADLRILTTGDVKQRRNTLVASSTNEQDTASHCLAVSCYEAFAAESQASWPNRRRTNYWTTTLRPSTFFAVALAVPAYLTGTALLGASA